MDSVIGISLGVLCVMACEIGGYLLARTHYRFLTRNKTMTTSEKDKFEAWWNGSRMSEPFAEKILRRVAWDAWCTALLQADNDCTSGKSLTITLPDTSSKAFWSGTGKSEVFHPDTYRRWVKEAIERDCTIAGIEVKVK